MQRKKIKKSISEEVVNYKLEPESPKQKPRKKKKITIEAKRVAAQLQLMPCAIDRQITDLIKRMDSD